MDLEKHLLFAEREYSEAFSEYFNFMVKYAFKKLNSKQIKKRDYLKAKKESALQDLVNLEERIYNENQ